MDPLQEIDYLKPRLLAEAAYDAYVSRALGVDPPGANSPMWCWVSELREKVAAETRAAWAARLKTSPYFFPFTVDVCVEAYAITRKLKGYPARSRNKIAAMRRLLAAPVALAALVVLRQNREQSLFNDMPAESENWTIREHSRDDILARTKKAWAEIISVSEAWAPQPGSEFYVEDFPYGIDGVVVLYRKLSKLPDKELRVWETRLNEAREQKV